MKKFIKSKKFKILILTLVLVSTVSAIAIYNLSGSMCEGQEDAAALFVTDGVQTPLFTYKLHTGSYPTTAQGLNALLVCPPGVTGWKGPYVDSMPLDPWQHPYQYAYNGPHNPGKYDCWSLGPDGINGTSDDIGNW